MTDKNLKKLSRADLLELLLEESKENERLREKLRVASEKLKDKTILIENAGSIAEAAMQLNNVFAAAEAAAQQYLDNVRRMAVGTAVEPETDDDLLSEILSSSDE